MSSPSEAYRCRLCERWCAVIRFKVIRADLGGVSYDIAHCADCQFDFAEGPVGPELANQVYSRYFYTSGQQTAPHNADGSLAASAEKSPIVANSRFRVDWLAGLKLGGSLLDIGAGRGYFVHCASTQFDAMGLEIQKSAVEFARRFGTNVMHGDLMTCDLGDRTFDVATLWDVFAGFASPRAALDRILQLVKPGGHIVMTLPDISSFAARLLGSKWPLMIPPGNLQYHTPHSVSRLLDHPGIHDYEIIYQSKLVNVGFIAHKLLRSLGLHHAAHVILPIPFKWSIPLNLYDIMTVIICKKSSVLQTFERSSKDPSP
jgi:SAM-dependent methyltransferase